jgi:eukaryotic-like serine/threonine-protein kinase
VEKENGESNSGTPSAILAPTHLVSEEPMPNLLSWRKRDRTPEQYTFTPELRTALNKKMQNIIAASSRDHEHAVYVELGLQEAPALVTPTWRKHVPGGVREREVSQDIYPIFEESEKLLIVGAPGAGKSTMLRRLCVELLLRAEHDPHIPIAVIVNLASFSQHKDTFEKWLFQAMHETLERPIEFCEMLYRGGHITLLFDGLDEVIPNSRHSCVVAINDLVPRVSHMVVCCRLMEYKSLKMQLTFGNALIIQPITRSRAIEALKKEGRSTAGIREAIQSDKLFAELLETPLMLHVAIIAFSNQQVIALKASTLTELRTKLYTAYVRRMLQQRPLRGYSQEQTVRWLYWLGRTTYDSKSVTLRVELLQPKILTHQWLFAVLEISTQVFGFALITSGLFIIVNRLKVEFTFGGRETFVLGLMIFILFITVLISKFLFQLSLQNNIHPVEKISWSYRYMQQNISLVIMTGAFFGAMGGFIGWMLEEMGGKIISGDVYWSAINLAANMGGMFVVGLIVGGVGGLIHGSIKQGWVRNLSTRTVKPNQGTHASLMNGAKEGSLDGLVAGVEMMLVLRVFGKPDLDIMMGVTSGAILGVITALEGGIGEYLKHYLLRFLLWREGKAPLRYVDFLENCCELLLLRRFGGAYQFYHITLRDYFADLTPEQIEEILKP